MEMNNSSSVFYLSSEDGSYSKKIRQYIKSGKNNGTETTVIFKEGEYYLESPICLGKSDNAVTLKADGKVRLIGGKRVRNFEKVTDKKVSGRFEEAVRDKILQYDLAKNGVSIGGFTSRGFDRAIASSHTEIFINGIPCNVAQYPKKGNFEHITGYLKEQSNEWNEKVGELGSGFRYNSERPKKWAKSDDIFVHGYWAWDWANTYERVAELDSDAMIVKTAPPYGAYAFKKGQRFYFLNILEEVTEPGDYYIDRESGMMYFYPYEDTGCEEVIASVMDQPLLEINGSENIRIEGLSFEAARGNALVAAKSDSIQIDNCTFKNIGNYAVILKGCKNSKVTACTVHDTGDGGICVLSEEADLKLIDPHIISDSRKALTPAGISIHNNHIHNIAKWSRTYQTAVNITGEVGVSVTNNLIHNCPHTAIMFWGNDITIKDNEIYDVVMETGDAGAVYIGRDYTFRGNKVCRNYIHHLGGVGIGTMGIYNDDCVSGTLMEDNYFFEVYRAVFMGGGRDFVVKNNVFVNCYPAVEMDGRGAAGHAVWKKMVYTFMKKKFYDVGGDKPLYLRKYPELAVIDKFYRENKPITPSALVENNIYCCKEQLRFCYGQGETGEMLSRSNFWCDDVDFVDYKFGDFRVKDGNHALDFGHRNIDMGSIGLVEEERKENPPKVISCLDIDMHRSELVLSLKNVSGKSVRGRFDFYADKPVEGLNEASIDIELAPFETGEFFARLPQIYEDVIIDAKCDVPGVRPCKAHYECKNGTASRDKQ